MKYTAIIRRESDGSTVERAFDIKNQHLDGLDYLWGKGNFSCDCNRSIFYGIPQDECSEGRYKIRLISETGEILLDELTAFG